MSMKGSIGKLGMMMAMASVLGGAGSSLVGGDFSPPTPPSKPKKRVLSPEQEVELFEKAKEKLFLELASQNLERSQKFPKFKEFEVHGLPVIAFSLKNATRDLENLMKQNRIGIETV